MSAGPARASAVMFDLDGTLVQTRTASWEVFRQISAEFDLGLTAPREYFELFNGNIFSSLDELCRGRADSGQVRDAFLARLRAEYNPAMIPGMTDVVRRLAGYCTLAVVSSNAMEVLRRVLVSNGVAYCFAHVFGGDMIPDKGTAIRSFLADAGSRYGRRCEVVYDETPAPVAPEPGTTVLVTDTAGDVRDAVAAGIRAVGVTWGMHEAGELTAAGAEFVAIWPQELPGYLLGDGPVEPVGACAVPMGGVVPASGAEGEGCGGVGGACGCGGGGAAEAGSGGDGRRAGQVIAAAAVRRGRRVRAARGDWPAAVAQVRPGQVRPERGGPAGGDAELRDAVRRILPAARPG